MKNYFSLILITCFLLINCATSVKKSTKSKIEANDAMFLFYNVENLFDTENDIKTNDDEFTPKGRKKWTKKRYDKKLENLTVAVSLARPDNFPEFIGLAEVENRKVLEDWTNTSGMKANNYKIVHYDSNDGRGIDVALLYKEAAFSLIDSKLIPVGKTQDSKYPLREILYAKGILYNTDTLHIFVNHWKSRRGGETKTEKQRMKSAKILRRKVDELLAENKNVKIIICGDMNDEPENKSLSAVLKAQKTINEANTTGLYNVMFQKSLKEKGSYSYSGNWLMLDNLIVSKALINSEKGFIINSKEGEIVYDKKILYKNSKIGQFVPSKTYGGENYYGGYSDHLPVYFTMKKAK